MISDESNLPEGKAIDREKNQPGVLCRRCDHLNYTGRDDCEDCGAPLFVECPHCGGRAPRVYTRCPQCRHRLRNRGGQRRKKHGDHGRGAHASGRKPTRQLLWALGIMFVLFGTAALVLTLLKR